MEGFKRLKAQLLVISVDAASALQFFGYSAATHEAVEIAEPDQPERWLPGTRVYEVRRKSSASN